MTSKLAIDVASHRAEHGVRVTLDGPYGGIHGGLANYDRVLLLGGGSGELVAFLARPAFLSSLALLDPELMYALQGGSFLLSLLSHLTQPENGTMCKMVDVVYSCRSLGTSFNRSHHRVSSILLSHTI